MANEPFCPNCGIQQLKTDARFCHRCGTAMPRSRRATAAEPVPRHRAQGGRHHRQVRRTIGVGCG